MTWGPLPFSRAQIGKKGMVHYTPGLYKWGLQACTIHAEIKDGKLNVLQINTDIFYDMKFKTVYYIS